MTPQMEQELHLEQLWYALMIEREQSGSLSEFEQWNEACAAMAEKIKAMGRGN